MHEWNASQTAKSTDDADDIDDGGFCFLLMVINLCDIHSKFSLLASAKKIRTRLALATFFR